MESLNSKITNANPICSTCSEYKEKLIYLNNENSNLKNEVSNLKYQLDQSKNVLLFYGGIVGIIASILSIKGLISFFS